jgi:HSP20 family protein
MNSNTIVTTKRNEPLSLFDTFFDDRFSRVFDRFWFAPNSQNTYGVDITDKEYIITLELPGFKKENVQVEVKNQTLFITAKTLKSKVSRSFRYFDWNPAEAKNKLEDGILTIKVPRVEESQSKLLEIE